MIITENDTTFKTTRRVKIFYFIICNKKCELYLKQNYSENRLNWFKFWFMYIKSKIKPKYQKWFFLCNQDTVNLFLK